MTNTTHFIAPLTTYSIVRVSGADAETFLQGQLSCDVKEVTTEQSSLGTANTSKGRTYAMFRIAKLADDYLIRLPSELAQDFVARLSKYIVFSKATIAIDEQWLALGFVGDIDKDLERERTIDKIIINIPSSTVPRQEVWCTQDVAKTILEKEVKSTSTQADWEWFEVNEGIAEVFTETQENFVPQMLNLQHLNAISFKKGCYTGQEIIARMKYLGKLKKATFLLSISPAIDIKPGATIFESESDKKRGTIVRSASSETNNTSLMLVVLDIESVKSGMAFSLSENSNIAAKLLSLPYEE